MNISAEVLDPETTSVEAKKTHPPGLYLLFATEMWERFSYYGMRALLTLFLTTTVMRGGMGFSEGDGSVIYGWFTGLVYLTPILGGYLADHFIGQRRAILIGGILMALGQFSLAAGFHLNGVLDYAHAIPEGATQLQKLPHILAAIVGLPGLLLLIIGNGFFKPNISTIVGQLYKQGDPRRDSAFTIFYMGINFGALIAPLVCGYLAEDYFATKSGDEILRYAFSYGFLAAGCGMVLGQIIFNLLAPKYLGTIGVAPSAKTKSAEDSAEDAPLTKPEKDRMTVIFIITTFVTFFWAGFEQAGSSLTLYTNNFIDRKIVFMDWTVPTSWFQSVNAGFIVLLAIPVAAMWLYLATRKKDLSIPVKMGLGMILLGVGFLFMVYAAYSRGERLEMTPEQVKEISAKAALWTLIATYFFHTIGELCLSPIGLSMITRLAPVKYASMLMGVWFLSPFVAQIAGGYIAAYVEELGALSIFGAIAGFVFLAGFIMLALNKMLVRMMHGRG